MRKNALFKTSLREVKQSKTRFLSIFGIIFLGVMVFVGLKATGPDMTQTASNYFNKQQLPDARVLSSLGLTEQDVKEIEAVPEVDKVVPRYSKDIIVGKENQAIKFVGYSKESSDQLLNYKVVEGKLPEKSGEIALDELALQRQEYKIGDKVSISKSNDKDTAFKTYTYKVVGFVRSAEYIENTTRGNTTVGKGTIDYFALIPTEDMALSVYTDILISFKEAATENSYSSEYKKIRDDGLKKLKAQLKKRPEERVEEIKSEAEDSFEDAEKEIADGEKALTDAEATLNASKKELDEGQRQYEESKATFDQQIAQAQAEINQNQTALAASEAELVTQEQTVYENQQLLDASSEQIQQAREALPALQQQRNELGTANDYANQAFNGYQSFASSIAHLQTIEDEQLTEIVNQQVSQLQGMLQNLQPSETLIASVDQLIATPSKAAIAEVMNAINQTLTEISAQQTQTSQGLAAIDQQIAQLNGSISQYEQGQQALAAAQLQLVDARTQIEAGKAQLAQGQQELTTQMIEGQAALDEAKAKLDEGQRAYEEGLAKFEKEKNENQPKLQEAKENLNKKKKELSEMKAASYYYFSRENNPGYTEYEENANRIASLSTVFPLFFFLIAALVSLTTMTRMVEEKRGEIGSLKALGYRNHEIAFKFLLYAVTASLSGGILGLIVGYYLFPTIIFDAYGQLYNIPDFVTPWYLGYSLIALLIAVLCTAGAAMIVLRIDLYGTPASLLRPKAPKAGKRIFLERLTPLWNRMSFIEKVTARNLFRYKQRMLMTVLGIAGCMALIITGFGLRDSISDVVNIQFGQLLHYQTVVTYNAEADEAEKKQYEASRQQLSGLKEVMPVASEILETKGENVGKQDVSVYVPEKPKEIAEFILFNDRKTKESYSLTDEGVIVNEKLAKLFDYQAGDMLTLTNAENQSYKVKIASVAENYAGHFIYMTPAYYEKVFKKTPVYNTDFLLFNQKLSSKEESKISESILANDNVVNVSFLSTTSSALDSTIDSLNIVIWVLITVSGLLAFIVLYNLTNINVSERIRELSTIKVLGFYDNEVTMYVYRENIILTILGILIGCLFGKAVHTYVLATVEVDLLMFSPVIHWISYVYAGIITFLFSLFVMIIMHRKLKKVDMIEALKSNE